MRINFHVSLLASGDRKEDARKSSRYEIGGIIPGEQGKEVERNDVATKHCKVLFFIFILFIYYFIFSFSLFFFLFMNTSSQIISFSFLLIKGILPVNK